MVRFQYVSDVHLELYKQRPSKVDRFHIRAEAPYLILAGDIGDPSSDVYTRFLTRLSTMFRRIFIVAGNHEYYAYNRDEDIRSCAKPNCEDWIDVVNARIKAVTARFSNVEFLNNTHCNIVEFGIVIFGATFWTDILPVEKEEVMCNVNDYQQIPGLTIEKVISMHRASRNALRKLLQSMRTTANAAGCKMSRVIVVSHHLPSYQLIDPRFKDSKTNSSYATDIPEAQCDDIVAWVAGHTHRQSQLGKFFVNPIGYKGEVVHHTFNKSFEVI